MNEAVGKAFKAWQLLVSEDSAGIASAVQDLNAQVQELAGKVAKLEEVLK